MFSLILCEEQFCSSKCGYDIATWVNHYNGPGGVETVWLMAAPSTIHGPHHHQLWCTWLWYVEDNPLTCYSSQGLAQLLAIDDDHFYMDCLMMYITPWSLAGIAVPVTFISVAIRFFNIGMEQD